MLEHLYGRRAGAAQRGHFSALFVLQRPAEISRLAAGKSFPGSAAG